MRTSSICHWSEGCINSEESSEWISIPDWIATIVGPIAGITKDPNNIYRFLQEQGKPFREVWEDYPQGLVRPAVTRPFKCHQNVWDYAKLLMIRQPHLLDRIRFVSGLYGLHATDDTVPAAQQYFVDRHTFMTYDGKVLDCTLLNHPPACYQAYQYFGISYEIPQVLAALEPGKGNAMLEELYRKLYFK